MLRSEFYLSVLGQGSLIGAARCSRPCWDLRMEKQENLRIAPNFILF